MSPSVDETGNTPMSGKVILRPARKSEARIIARLYRIASDGVSDYIWSKLAEAGEDLLDVGQRRYEREDTPFSYENCTIAEVCGQVAGMLVAFPMHVDPLHEETDPVLVPYSRLEEDDSWYVCGVGLFPEYRNRGIGSLLMQHAEGQAARWHLGKLSLIVFEQNTGARRLYERLGYVETARQTVYPHPLIQYGGDALLMVKHLK